MNTSIRTRQIDEAVRRTAILQDGKIVVRITQRDGVQVDIGGYHGTAWPDNVILFRAIRSEFFRIMREGT